MAKQTKPTAVEVPVEVDVFVEAGPEAPPEQEGSSGELGDAFAEGVAEAQAAVADAVAELADELALEGEPEAEPVKTGPLVEGTADELFADVLKARKKTARAGRQLDLARAEQALAEARQQAAAYTWDKDAEIADSVLYALDQLEERVNQLKP